MTVNTAKEMSEMSEYGEDTSLQRGVPLSNKSRAEHPPPLDGRVERCGNEDGDIGALRVGRREAGAW